MLLKSALSALMLAGAAGSVQACDAPAARAVPSALLFEGRAHPVQLERRAAEEQSITINTGGKMFTIRIRGDETTATIDGKPVPADRIERRDGKVIIKGAGGETLLDANVSASGGVSWTRGTGIPTPAEWPTPEPRPMIGITMSGVDRELADQLNVDPGAVVLISSVVDGMPAEEAGLRRSDVVIAVDGESPVTQDRLREVVGAKRDGDTVTLRVLRRGERVEVPIKVRMSQPEANVVIDEDSFNWRGDPELQAMLESARRAAAEAGAQGADAARSWAMRMRGGLAQTQAALEEFEAQLSAEFEKLGRALTLTEEEREKLEDALDRLTDALSDIEVDVDMPRIRVFRPGQGEEPAIVLPPAPPPAPAAPMAPGPSRRAEGAERERMDRMEDRMRRIEELLERLAEERRPGQ